MPYTYSVLGYRADLRHLSEEHAYVIKADLAEICEEPADLGFYEDRLEELAIGFPNLELELTLEGESGPVQVLRLKGGEVAKEVDRAKRHVRELLMPRTGAMQTRLDKVAKLGRARAPQSIPELVGYLEGATGSSSLAGKLRREIYDALSWHETDQVRELLLKGLERETDENAGAIVYVMWRQPALIATLPPRIDSAAAAGDARLVRRLLEALLRHDEAREHRAWVLAHYGEIAASHLDLASL
jgi:hypothetical protein